MRPPSLGEAALHEIRAASERAFHDFLVMGNRESLGGKPRLMVSRPNSTAHPPTRPLVIRSPSFVARTYISLGQPFSRSGRTEGVKNISSLFCKNFSTGSRGNLRF